MTQLLIIMLELHVHIHCKSYRTLCTAQKCGCSPLPSTLPLIKVTHISTSGLVSWLRIRFTMCIYLQSHCFEVTPDRIRSRQPASSSTLCILYGRRLWLRCHPTEIDQWQGGPKASSHRLTGWLATEWFTYSVVFIISILSCRESTKNHLMMSSRES